MFLQYWFTVNLRFLNTTRVSCFGWLLSPKYLSLHLSGKSGFYVKIRCTVPLIIFFHTFPTLNSAVTSFKKYFSSAPFYQGERTIFFGRLVLLALNRLPCLWKLLITDLYVDSSTTSLKSPKSLIHHIFNFVFSFFFSSVNSYLRLIFVYIKIPGHNLLYIADLFLNTLFIRERERGLDNFVYF